MEEYEFMNGNLAYQEESREELHNGEIVMMSSPSVNHNRVASRIFSAFYNYLKGKSCEIFNYGVDVFVTENDRVIPDVMIVCNKDIIQKDGIHGAPDLIVEVLSPGTAKSDKSYKKTLYENFGVREYWIVDTELRSIEVYLLSDGKYYLDEIYRLPNDNMIDREKECCKDIVPVSLYDDFSIPLDEIFYGLF